MIHISAFTLLGIVLILMLGGYLSKRAADDALREWSKETPAEARKREAFLESLREEKRARRRVAPRR